MIYLFYFFTFLGSAAAFSFSSAIFCKIITIRGWNQSGEQRRRISQNSQQNTLPFFKNGSYQVNHSRLGYLQVFLGGSVIWRQRVVSLSHLYQPLFNNFLFLQRPNQKMLTDHPKELYKHLWHLASAQQVRYLDNVLSGNWFRLFGCGCDVLQGVRQSIQGGVCSGFQLNKHRQKHLKWNQKV